MTDRHEKKKATMAENLQAQTGRSVDEWRQLVDAAGISGFSAIVNWLKSEHGLGHFQARSVAEAARDAD